METNSPAVIADTSALVSLAIDTDHNHTVATGEAARLQDAALPIILPADVFVETINILGKRSGHETALRAADALLRLGSQFVLVDTGPYIKTALAKFKDQLPAVSFTDCIVMAVADHYGTKDIFGFDKQFVEAGYHRLTPSADWEKAA